MEYPENLNEALTTSGIGYWRDEIYRVVYIRAGFRCEYCGCHLVNGFQAYYAFWHLDHILPKSIYKNLGGPKYYGYTQTCTEYRNLALACCACNKFKGEFDGGGGIVTRDVTDLDENQREWLLARARSHVRAQRATLSEDHGRLCSLLREFDVL